MQKRNIEAFQGLASGIYADMEIYDRGQKIPNRETKEAIRKCKKGQAQEYESFSVFWEEVEKKCVLKLQIENSS